MKHVSKNKVFGFAKKNASSFFSPNEPQEIFHPMSYYVDGGVDIAGDALDNSASVEFDTEDQLTDLRDAGFSAVPFGDPRESKFSLIEKYGSYEAEKISSKSNSTSKIETTTDTTTE